MGRTPGSRVGTVPADSAAFAARGHPQRTAVSMWWATDSRSAPWDVRCGMLTELRLIDAYWRAANYLAIGQIYLKDNPLLREALTLDHVKPRLLGHCGTTPGLTFIHAHMNRAINARDLNA